MEIEINPNFLEVGALNSNKFDPKDFVKYQSDDTDDLPLPKAMGIPGYDMKVEQNKDPSVADLIDQTSHEKLPKTNALKFMLIEGVLYYLSNPNDGPLLRLCIPAHLKYEVINQYHGQKHVLPQTKLLKPWPNCYYKKSSRELDVPLKLSRTMVLKMSMQ